ENHIANIAYHPKCRSLFTMKRDLESIEQKKESVEEEPSPMFACNDPICIFCNKLREKLIQAVPLRADATLCHCVILNNDARILAITSRDIMATEAHYPASCCKSSTNIETMKFECDHVGDKEKENLSQVTDMISYKEAEVEAYVQLFHHIRNEVTPHKVVTVAKLTKRLEAFISSKGEALKTATKNICRRLESELDNSIYIFPKDQG
ncbi:unnamed protein product, partial [Pocillopora meandrina]